MSKTIAIANQKGGVGKTTAGVGVSVRVIGFAGISITKTSTTLFVYV